MRNAHRSPPHGPWECLVLASWLLLFAGSGLAAAWYLASALL